MTATNTTAAPELTDAQREALRRFGVLTQGRFSFWTLAGNHMAGNRVHVLTALWGRKVTQREAGITVLTDALMAVLVPAGHGLCRAAAETEFLLRARALGLDTRPGCGK